MSQTFLGSSAGAAADVRPSPIAGQWYPGTPQALRDKVQSLLDAVLRQAQDDRDDRQAPLALRVSASEDDQDARAREPVALVAPHAGYTYSGRVAAHAYRWVQGRSYDVVIVVAPNHRIGTCAPYLTTAHEAYGTPLGAVPVDQELLDALGARLDLTPLRRDEEHSLEIQLPFLQVALAGEFRLLPVMANDPSPEAARALGQALGKVLDGRDALLVASTDLSHFYDADTAARLDRAVTDRIAAFDPQGLMEVLQQDKGQACGGAPTAAVMWAARALGADQACLLKYATSGDVTGDYHSVVGYAAAVLYRAGGET